MTFIPVFAAECCDRIWEMQICNNFSIGYGDHGCILEIALCDNADSAIPLSDLATHQHCDDDFYDIAVYRVWDKNKKKYVVWDGWDK